MGSVKPSMWMSHTRIGDLVLKTEAEMLQYRNFGKKSLKEIQDLIGTMGFHFGMDVSRYLGTTKPQTDEEDEDLETDAVELEEEDADR